MRWKVLGGVLTGVCVLQSAIAAGGSYKSLGEIPIGGEGGWDILTIDSPAQRLYQSHAIKVVVIDLAQREVAGEIHGLPGVHAFSPSRN